MAACAALQIRGFAWALLPSESQKGRPMSQSPPQFHAEGVTIAFHDQQWVLQGSEMTAAPLFQADQVDKFVHFSPAFAQAREVSEADLPLECIQAVVAGFDEKHKQWRAGLHLVIWQENRPLFI